ncbi:hypothetical protein JCM6292_388 [Bacteroides pyogenes JCM 6292]|uniref:Uncharacterized protein n=2 Tax=Bacteroides pyogenes TaxID=310300 RepID=W4PFW4_9BACE|nr:hypothetical protein JCM6292_388 [Bacteroides pyogenes JCM 6292]GAE18039.1 hypothetical protein JCM6294_877 [Bacteroides pyogenes DSM 20611 = JCM 6294]
MKKNAFLSYEVIRSSQCNHCRKGNSFLLTQVFITVENLSKLSAKIFKNNSCFIQNKI